MSWATKAARSKRNDVVPGSSAFFKTELKISTSASLEKVQLVHDEVKRNFDHLNLIRDIIHGEKTSQLDTELWDILQDLNALELSESNHDYKTQEYSNTSNTPHITKASSIPDQSLGSNKNSNSEISKHEKRSKIFLDTNQIQTKETVENNVKNNVLGDDGTKHSSHDILTNDFFPAPPITAPLSSSPPLKKHVNNSISDNYPMTSPQVDLSFIPIANTINLMKPIRKPSSEDIDKLHSYNEIILNSINHKIEDPDDSFQAISSAIRKSFAGKSSMIHNPVRSSDHKPVLVNKSSPDNKYFSDLLPPKLTSGAPPTANSATLPKVEPLSSSKKSIAHKTPKRSSVYIPLPTREPIGLPSSLPQSNKDKSFQPQQPSNVLQRLEASKNDTHRNSVSQGYQSQQKASTHPSVLDSNYIRHSMKGRLSTKLLNTSQESIEHSKVTPGLLTKSTGPKTQTVRDGQYNTLSTGKDETPVSRPGSSLKITQPSKFPHIDKRSRLPSSQVSDDFLRRSRNVFMNHNMEQSEQFGSKTLIDLHGSKYDLKSVPEPSAKPRTRSPSRPTPIYSAGLRSRSPIRSRTRSPLKSQTRSPVKSRAGSPNKLRQPVHDANLKLASYSSRDTSPKRRRLSNNNFKSRSPTRYGFQGKLGIDSIDSVKNSPTDHISMKSTLENKTFRDQKENELVNRLMAPTSSSAAKSIKSPSREKEERDMGRESELEDSRERENERNAAKEKAKQKEIQIQKEKDQLHVPQYKKSDAIIKNKFLTTSLDPDNPPKFSIASKSQKLAPLPSKKHMLPMGEDLNLRPTKSRDSKRFGSIIEKYEVDAHKAHEKSTRPSYHKPEIVFNGLTSLRLQSPSHNKHSESDKKSDSAQSKSITKSSNSANNFGNKSEPISKLNVNDVTIKPHKKPNDNLIESQLHSIRRGATAGNAIPLPDEARGKFSRRKGRVGTAGPSKGSNDASGMDKSNILNGLNDYDTHNEAPKTPLRNNTHYTADNLPDIPSDDEQNNKGEKYLQNWAATPELQKRMEEKRNVDPVTIFGEVPALDMDEIFESQASRYRGRPSPIHGP